MSILIIKSSDIMRCPKHSLSPDHYFPDGSCKCVDAKTLTLKQKEERAIAEYECPVCKAIKGLQCINQNATRKDYRLKRPHSERVQLVDPEHKIRHRRAQWNTEKGI